MSNSQKFVKGKPVRWHHDPSNRPDGMSRSQWIELSQAEQEALMEKQEEDKAEEASEFEAHMQYGALATAELTWLRDRLIKLEEKVNESP